MTSAPQQTQAFTLPAGTVVKRNGIPFALQHATQIECHPDNWPLIKGEPPEAVEIEAANPLRPLAPTGAEQLIPRLERLSPAEIVSMAWDRSLHKPAPFKPSTGAVAVALKAARLALLSNDNCLITDRPDLPLSQETSWTTDFSGELALIDAAIGRTASLCANESTCLQTAPKSSPAKSEQELRRSRSPDQDRL